MPAQSDNEISYLVAPVLKDVLKLLRFSMTDLEVSRVVFAQSEDTLVMFPKLAELRIGDRIFLTMKIYNGKRKFDIVALYDLEPSGLTEFYFKAYSADEFRGEDASDAELAQAQRRILGFVLIKLLNGSFNAAREEPDSYPKYVVGFKRWFREYVYDLLIKYRDSS